MKKITLLIILSLTSCYYPYNPYVNFPNRYNTYTFYKNGYRFNRDENYEYAYRGECIETVNDYEDLFWRVGTTINSRDSYSLISNLSNLIGYTLDKSNPRNYRGCR